MIYKVAALNCSQQKMQNYLIALFFSARIMQEEITFNANMSLYTEKSVIIITYPKRLTP